jgi:K+-transporting ATPase ATPase A chain
MGASALFAVPLFLGVLLVLAYPLGHALARIGDPAPLPGFAGTIERRICGWAGVDAGEEMPWARYGAALLLFNAVGFFVVYVLQRVQAWLPFNPDGMTNVAPDLAFNTAVSFVTNTNWQAYSGESALSYLTQMAALAVQNFASAATGLAVAFALIRGFARRSAAGVGNFWVDLTRGSLYVLLPLSIVLCVALMGQGVVQTFSAHREVHVIDPLAHGAPALGKAATQSISLGPVASQEAIKMLGTNGGGFFGANSAHPYENPTPLTNFLQMLAMALIPAALCFAFGRMVGDMRQGWAIIGAMTLIFVAMAGVALWSEAQGNPGLAALHVDQVPSVLQAGGNMEGKETRFGTVASALFATLTTAISCGAVNAMHDSFNPLGGLVPMWLMQLGEVVYGGVGAGLYGMLIFAIMAVFVAGLMIGRTPEYLGKKIESFEMKMTSIVILVTPFLVLVGSALAVMTEAGRAGIANPGPHGFSEILYAYSSAANNNGSAFAGLSVNRPFYNLTTAVAMWFGRFAFIIPVLAIAGSLARKKRIEPTAGTLPTHGALFVVLLIGTVVLVGALTYVPALALGPVVEHLQLFAAHARS